MQTYEHGGDIYGNTGVLLDFSVNLNPLGMPEPVARAVAESVSSYETYPDPFCRALCERLSESEGVPRSFVLCGNGAADLIVRLCLALRPRRALIPMPTFSEYARSVRMAGGSVWEYAMPAADGFPLTDAFINTVTDAVDMVFLCTPNNPTGRLIDPGLIERLAARCDACGCTLVVDECFLPFTSGASVVPLMQTYKNLVVLRAFTKLYAMAGLRLGYLMSADAALLERVSDMGQVWSVSAAAQVAGRAALACEPEWTERTRLLVREERACLTGELTRLGLDVLPGEANFLLVRAARPLYGPLLDKGILVRACENFPGLDERYFRIGVKTHKKNSVFLRTLNDLSV